MSNCISITTLVENSVTERGLVAEHGLAFFIQSERFQLLFDTGQTEIILQNARELNLPLASLDAIALSHGHYDHTGGLAAVLKMAPQAKIFFHPAALAPKFARSPAGKTRSMGVNPQNLQVLQQQKSRTVETIQVTEIAHGIFLTGQIPRQTPFEDTGGKFFLDETCAQPDPLLDDQALFFDTKNGLVVLLGCAHSGVVNTLNYIRQITGSRPIICLMGGLHLLSANENRVQKTIQAFQDYDIQRLAPGHCTGLPAIVQLWASFPGRCASCSVGIKVEFPA